MYKPIYKEKYKKLYNINYNIPQIPKTYTYVVIKYISSPPPYEEFDVSLLYHLTPIKLKQLVINNLIYFTKEECNNYIQVFSELKNLYY